VTRPVDKRVIKSPVTTWSVPAVDLRVTVEEVQDDALGNFALANVL
jgi:hypothetical protein